MVKYELDYLINHVEESVEKANNGISKLTKEILGMEGMSGIKTRHLYNNICNLKNVNYLEVGTCKGSSFISTLYGNNVNAIAVDNWSEFNGPKNEFFANMQNLCPNIKYNFIEKDCFTVSDNEIFDIYNGIDVYLYDGAHDYQSQKNAITYYSRFLSKYSIIIIDDFRSDTQNWAQVKKGTHDGLTESGLIVHKNIEIISKQESNGSTEYWNGFGLFVCEKK